jgi:hypothetical protein
MAITHSSAIQDLLLQVAPRTLHRVEFESVDFATKLALAPAPLVQAREMVRRTGRVLREKMNTLRRARLRAATVCLRCFTYDRWPIVAVGSLPELGEWDPNRALPMQLEIELDGLREWRTSFKCPAGQPFEFKFVAAAEWGPLWEPGENRTCRADEPCVAVDGEFQQHDYWRSQGAPSGGRPSNTLSACRSNSGSSPAGIAPATCRQSKQARVDCRHWGRTSLEGAVSRRHEQRTRP